MARYSHSGWSTCGIDGKYFPDAGPDEQRIEDVIPLIARQGQIHAPGAELSYCNSGAVLAGYLAQRLLGKSWYTLIEERIFKPLELQHSVVQPADALLHRATVGHFLNTDGTNARTSFAFLNPSFAPAGATAMLAAKDVATFALAHVNDGVGTNGHRLLSAASARRMRRQTATWRGVGGGGFGLGWMTMDRGIVGHDGGGPGMKRASHSGCARSCGSTTATHWRNRRRFRCARSATATSRLGRASSRSSIQARRPDAARGLSPAPAQTERVRATIDARLILARYAR